MNIKLLAQYLRDAEAEHAKVEPQLKTAGIDWPEWYAAFIDARIESSHTDATLAALFATHFTSTK